MPVVARAALSPVSLGGAAAGVATALITGAGLVGAAILGPLGAAGGTAIVLWRSRRHRRPLLRDRIDPFAVGEPWRHHVRAALQARNRFDEALRPIPPGPLRDRLAALRATVDDGVRECWEVAKRAQTVAEARRRIDADAVRRRVDQLQPGGDTPGDGAEAATARALRAQLEAAGRLDRVLADTRARLELLDARLAETVSRVAEMSAIANGDGDLTRLGADLGDVVVELEALRDALAETGGDVGTG